MLVDTLRAALEELVARRPEEAGTRAWWRSPLLVAAPVDQRFDILTQIAADDHLAPADLLDSARSVVVFFIPFQPWLGQENAGGKWPVRDWSIAYNDTNQLIAAGCERLSQALAEAGHRSAVTPPTANFDTERLLSRWSHKHLAHLCGLGRFGVNSQMITPAGCLGRLGSLVTEAELGDHPLVTVPELCLHRAGKACLKCVDACPVGALSPGKPCNRRRCWDRLLTVRKHPDHADLPEHTQVCGKCQAGMPCSVAAPMPVNPKERNQ